MPTLGASLDFAKYEARNIRGHQLGTAPASPVTGQLYYNTGDNTLYWWDGTQWVSARGGAAAVPPATASVQGTIQLAGDLAGTAASPQIATGVIVDTDVAAANKDGVAGTPSLRTLGAGAQQAAAGNDARFTNARTPTAHATTHQPGGSDTMAVDAATGTGSLRTLGLGAVQAMPGNITLDSITQPAFDLSMNGKRIYNLQDPVGQGDAATKLYVDNLVQGLDAKQSARAATTANIANLAAGAPNTLDGVTLAANDRILVKDQTTLSQNGIYVVNSLGTGANGAWIRANDSDTWPELVNAYAWIEQGTTQADTGWVCTVDQGGTIGTTNVTWVQFSAAGAAIAGAGLTKTGNTIDVGGTANRITVNPDTVDIAATYVGQASITTLGTITVGTWNGGTIPIANGGTGGTTPSAARQFLGATGKYGGTGPPSAGTTWNIPQATHLCSADEKLLVQVRDVATQAIEIPDVTIGGTGQVNITWGASVAQNSKTVLIIG